MNQLVFFKSKNENNTVLNEIKKVIEIVTNSNQEATNEVLIKKLDAINVLMTKNTNEKLSEVTFAILYKIDR